MEIAVERRSAIAWLTLVAALGTIAALALIFSDRFTKSHPALSDGLFIGGLVAAALSLIAVAVGCVLLFRVPKVRYEASVKDKDSSLRLSLSRRDDDAVGYAKCFLKRRNVVRGTKAIMSARRVTYTYPDDFEGPERDPPYAFGSPHEQPPLEVGRYRIEWWVTKRAVANIFSDEVEWRRVAKVHLRITDELRAAAERLLRRGTFFAWNEPRPDGKVHLRLLRHEVPVPRLQAAVRLRLADGSMGEQFFGHNQENSGDMEANLLFPDVFRREVGRTQTPSGAGIVDIEYEYEYPLGEPGDYEVVWSQVWYVTGGTFPIDHEIQMDDFRREREVATDRFTIEARDQT